MGFGGCIMAPSGRESRLDILYKIWKKYGTGAFKSSELQSILNEEEIGIANMNRFKHRNLVAHAGTFVERGRSIRMWKLTGYSRTLCKEMKRL
jgi:CRISPR/Cas system-associated protein Csx1